MLASFLFTVLILGLSSAEHTSFEPCSKADQECYRRTTEEFLRKVAAGYPAENFASLDPFVIDKLEFETPEAHYTLANNKVTGFKNVEVTKVTLEEKTGTMEFALKLTFDSDLVAVYRLKPEHVTLKGAETRNIDAVVKINYPFELVDGKDGEKHFKIGKETITFELKTPTAYTEPKEFTDFYKAHPEAKAIDDKNIALAENKDVLELQVINHLITACFENFRHLDEKHPAKHFVKDLIVAFEACSTADQECFSRTTQEFLRKGAAGYPAENLASLDPFVIEKLEFETPEAHYTLASKNVEVLNVTINYLFELVDVKDGEKQFKIGKETITFELKKPTTYSASKKFSDAYNTNAEAKAIDDRTISLSEFKDKFESEVINHLIAACFENIRRVDENHPAKIIVKYL